MPCLKLDRKRVAGLNQIYLGHNIKNLKVCLDIEKKNEREIGRKRRPDRVRQRQRDK